MTWLPTIIIGSFALFFAGLTQGLTGFGFALVSVPILSIILPPKIVIPTALIYGTILNLIILINTRKWVNIKKIWPLLVFGISGVPLGTYILLIFDVKILKIFIGTAIIAFAIILFKGFRKRIQKEKMLFAPVGFISGLLNGSITMSGPPVVLFFTNQGLAKNVFRANLVTYFFALNLATIPAFIIGDLITLDVLKLAVFLLPALFLGVIAGIRLVDRVKEGLFRRITLIIVILAGAFLIISGSGILR